MTATVQLIGGVSVEDALATLDQVLGFIAGATPTRVDDHIREYVQALRKSPELVELLERDLGREAKPQALNFSTIMAILEIIRLIRGGGDFAGIVKLIVDLLNRFRGNQPAGNPAPDLSGYVPNQASRC